VDGVTAIWAYAHVADVQRSVDFYAHLGFELRSSHQHDGRTVWAFVTAIDAPRAQSPGLMLAQADGPIDPESQGVLFYCWAEDVRGLRQRLVHEGIAAGEVRQPFYMPAGEIRVTDPDGYVLLIGQLEQD
jgi:catechol 2,3-dioxygenase-like lactoylglutathione lyase family enzyme